MTWMLTYTGKAFDLADPQPDQVDVRDIAHSLARICRYNGHTVHHYSVAEHCVQVALALQRDGFGPDVVLGGLLHDAAEAYVGDITFPLGQAVPELKDAHRRLTERVDHAIGLALRLHPVRWTHNQAVHLYDRRIVFDELAALLPDPPRPIEADPLGITIYSWDAETARGVWLTLFEQLAEQLGLHAHRAQQQQRSQNGTQEVG